MEKFQESYKDFCKIGFKFRDDCLNYLEDSLNKAENKRIDLDGHSALYVTYDGGKHPEYLSNVYSYVSAIFLNENDEIALKVEEEDEYTIDRLCTCEVYNVCSYVLKNI